MKALFKMLVSYSNFFFDQTFEAPCKLSIALRRLTLQDALIGFGN